MPFLVLYFEQVGLTGAQIGVLSGLMPGFILLAGPVWSGFADARDRTRGVLVLAAIGAAGARGSEPIQIP